MRLISKIHVSFKRCRQHNILLLILTVTCSLLLINGCTLSKQKETLPRLSNSGPPALHWVQSKRLERLMHEMEHLVFERLYSELERDHIRLRNTEQIANLLMEMASTIRTGGYMKNYLDLDEKNQIHFDKLAIGLAERAKNLKKAIKLNDPASLRIVTGQMITACNACHSQFRDMNIED